MSLFPSSRLPLRWFRNGFRRRAARRAALAGMLAVAMFVAFALGTASSRRRHAADQLRSAAERLDDLTYRAPADDHRRAAVAWGYAERLRLGLESPFRLIESAARDVRLTVEERRMVAWALLAHVLRGETHRIDPATLDGIGPSSVPGDRHLALIERAVTTAPNPRAAELAVRFAYTLAATERLVDASAPALTAAVAAMMGDRELARREAAEVIRSARNGDPIEEIRARRARFAFYVERPVLLASTVHLEGAAIAMSGLLLDSLRAMQASSAVVDSSPPVARSSVLAPRLYAAGAQLPPAAGVVVTVRRHMAVMRAQAPWLDHDALNRSRNTEMLVAVTRALTGGRAQRRAVGRLLVSTAVSMRSHAQQPVWFPGDTAPSAAELSARHGVASVSFEHDVPKAWRPFYLRQFDDGVERLRGVFPGLTLDALHIRFRLSSPASSALAMHDPRTRTLHLPVATAAGTLTHELAHDLDRLQALAQGHVGYRSDFVARSDVKARSRSVFSNTKVAASWRALSEELAEMPRTAGADRPAEVFATRVDWFVAQALASQGLSSGFLTAVQDELLTGHAVHPERLRPSGSSRSLATALEGMIAVAPFAVQEREPSAYALLRWSVMGTVDRNVAMELVRGATHVWTPPSLVGGGLACQQRDANRATLVRMAAESRARGWLRTRPRWNADAQRPVWTRALAGQGPWSPAIIERRVAQLRDWILVDLASTTALSAGLPAYGARLATRAICTD